VDRFVHEALLYAGEDGFVDKTLPFIREGIAADEPTMVAVSARKIARLEDELGAEARHVRFADMAQIGRNPAWIIPAWRVFVDEHAGSGRSLRGIGEPIDPDRSPAELVECHRHEALLNLAFADAPGFRLVCPYDTDVLDATVVEQARCTHPRVANGSGPEASPDYDGLDAIAAPFADPLPQPPPGAEQVAFDADGLPALRGLVSGRAADAGLGEDRTYDVTLAVAEVATNSVRHGGGAGELVIWSEGDTLLCEVRDGGRIVDPLAGRQHPAPEEGGYGLWLANQLCDLVQVRTLAGGAVVRLHVVRP
jgi:anti-sigma regulatory factor (Ser/Thr protein kinase)